MDAKLALAEALLKGFKVTPQVFQCDMCGHYHFGMIRAIDPKCARTGKFQFQDQEHAEKALRKMKRKAAAGSLQRQERSVYCCPFCKLWHTTSEEQRETTDGKP
jgi:hypothetical protein